MVGDKYRSAKRIIVLGCAGTCHNTGCRNASGSSRFVVLGRQYA
jgi:hypothetical protein